MADGERSEKGLVGDGIAWVRECREQLGWSQAKLAIRSTKMKGYLGELCPAPTTIDVAAFEAGELRQLPRWLNLAQYAFEFVTVPADGRVAWLNRRNWYYAGHPIDLCRPLLFRDEFRFIEALYGMSEPDRRAWRAAMTRWHGRTGERDRADTARDWLRRLEVKTEVLVRDEQELLEIYRRLSRRRQEEMMTNSREEDTLPRCLPQQPSDEEAALLAGFAELSHDQKAVIQVMTAKPDMLEVVIKMLTRMTPKQIDALVAETRSIE